MKPSSLLLLLPLLVSCNAPAPYATTEGILRPGATLRVEIARGRVDAYHPVAGRRAGLFTVSATAPSNQTPPAPRMRARGKDVTVTAGSLASLLVRVPAAVDLVVSSRDGDVNVTDIGGNAQIDAKHGNVTVMLPGYAQASVGEGTVAVTMGAMHWPGTLRFSASHGDITLRVPAPAAFSAHLQTDNGTLFTDFALRGSSHGSVETIDGSVNGGGAQRIWAHTGAGAVRLLRMQPQP